MALNYIKIALRNLIRNKIFSLFNLLSLTIGICSFLVIVLWVNYELSYDKHHKNYEQIYRINNKWPGSEIGLSCPGAAAEALKNDIPEIIKSTKYALTEECKIKYKEAFYCKSSYIDKDFFDIFDFSIIQGNTNNFFESPNSVVITESIAHKLFGDEKPIGKLINLDNGKYQLEVTGIITDAPKNSHINFDILIPAKLASQSINVWDNSWPHIYILLNEKKSASLVNEKLKAFIQKYQPEAANVLTLEPLSRINLYSAEGNGIIKYVITFLIIGFTVLLMSCLNYIILTTSLSFKRLKEIGVRKIVGAKKRQIIAQLLTETFVLSIIASFISILTIELVKPELIPFIGKEIETLSNIHLWFLVLVIIIITNLLAGIYPSIYSSRFNAIYIISNKGRLKVKSPRKLLSLSLSSILIIIQFSASIFLISSVLGINKQLNFIFNKDIGYTKENIITISFPLNSSENFKLAKEELLKYPIVENITLCYPHPVIQDGNTSIVLWKEKPEEKNVFTKFKFIDENYIETFDIKLIKGRFFKEEIKSDYLNHNEIENKNLCSYVINETLAKDLGFEDPVGKSIALVLSGNEFYGTIIGIVKDFNDESLYEQTKPITLVLYEAYNYLNIKLNSKIGQKHIKDIESVIRKFQPGYISNYEYISSQVEDLYKKENKSKILFRVAAILAVIISLLGLTGSLSFSIELMKKEIAIRKVNGAKFRDILKLMLGKYIIIQLVAIILSTPLFYYFITSWLKNFAYQTGITIWANIITAILLFILVVIIVILASFKSIRKNPVDSLRFE